MKRGTTPWGRRCAIGAVVTLGTSVTSWIDNRDPFRWSTAMRKLTSLIIFVIIAVHAPAI